MNSLKPEFFNTPCVKRLATIESESWIINDLVANILYGKENNIRLLDIFLRTIEFDEVIIEDAEDVVLLLRALNDQIYRDKLITAIEKYLKKNIGDNTIHFSLLLAKIVSELEDLDTLRLAHGICCNAWYIESKDLEISKYISDLISRDFFDQEMNKARERGEEIINSHKKESIWKIIPVVIVISALVLSLLS